VRITAQDQYDLGIADAIIPEPEGGAHTDAAAAAEAVGAALRTALDALVGLPIDVLLQRRYTRYRAIGRFQESQPMPNMPATVPPLPFKGS